MEVRQLHVPSSPLGCNTECVLQLMVWPCQVLVLVGVVWLELLVALGMSLALTLVNASTACWMSSGLCAALICVRMRACPFGTTG